MRESLTWQEIEALDFDTLTSNRGMWDYPLTQKGYKRTVVVDQLFEVHTIETRGRRHDYVGHPRNGRDLLHAPFCLRGRPKPFVDADASVGDDPRPELL